MKPSLSSASLAGLLLLWPLIGQAQPAEEPFFPTEQQRAAAYAACGGPPIQHGHHVQPTPDRNKCLAEYLHRLQQEAEAGPPPSAAAPKDGAPGKRARGTIPTAD